MLDIARVDMLGQISIKKWDGRDAVWDFIRNFAATMRKVKGIDESLEIDQVLNETTIAWREALDSAMEGRPMK